jgi:hypothetical protein
MAHTMSESLAAPPSGVDAGTAELILTMPCAGDDDVVRWFTLIQECYAANSSDFSAFAVQVRERATSFDQTAVEEFLECAESGDGLPAVAGVLEHLPAQVDIYWQLATPSATEAEAASEDEEPFAWVDQEQADRLSAAWGSEWQPSLTEQLDVRWGADWQANPAEHKHAWLTDLMTEFLAGDADLNEGSGSAGDTNLDKNVDPDEDIDLADL